MRKIVKVKLSKEFKGKAMKVLNDTIDTIACKYNVTLTDGEKRQIRNLSLDQINVNITHKSKSKTIWVFDAEETLPVIVEFDETKASTALDKSNQKRMYKMKPNLTWYYESEKKKPEGLTESEFEAENLKMLLEDFETAAFYGALSFITEEGDKKDGKC